MRYVDANPYPWPYNGDLRPDNTVVLVIDMQTDFCGAGGYVDAMGYDLSLTRAPIGPIRRICPPTSAGAVSASAPALAMSARAERFSCVASPGGS